MQQLLQKESVDSQCNRYWMGWMQTREQNWTNITVQNTITWCYMSTGFSKEKDQPRKLQIQSTLEKLKNRLSSKMSNRKFKLEPEQCSPKVSVKQYSTELKKMNFIVKWNKFQPIAMMQPRGTNYRECQNMSLLRPQGTYMLKKKWREVSVWNTQPSKWSKWCTHNLLYRRLAG